MGQPNGRVPRVFLAMSTVDNRPNLFAARGLFRASKTANVVETTQVGSLLARNFNTQWCMGLGYRKLHGVTHFAMLHGDIGPQNYWLDVLMDELHRLDAAVVSAVVPIKDPRGLTSTAIGDPLDAWVLPKRLSMHEIMELPETFCAADAGYPASPLLVNTGCWVANLRKPFWDELDELGRLKIHFTIQDRVSLGADGRWEISVIPEDWHFSRCLWERGAKVYATRKVRLQHYGDMAYPNTCAWGTHKEDQPEDVTVTELA